MSSRISLIKSILLLYVLFNTSNLFIAINLESFRFIKYIFYNSE